MNKFNLNNIELPSELSEVVDRAIDKACKKQRGARQMRILLRYGTTAAAILTVALLLFNSSQVLAFVENIFTSFQDSNLQNPSRDAIVENDYVKGVGSTPDTVSESAGTALKLDGYYADKNEIGFDFTLTGNGFPDQYDFVMFDQLALELIDESGESRIWEETYDRETQASTRIFPGGHFYEEPYEYVEGDGQDFSFQADIQRSEDGTYKLIGLVNFQKPTALGTQIKLHFGNLTFLDTGDLADDNAVPVVTTIAGEWNFTLDVDESFAAASTQAYEPANPKAASEQGIDIKRITVSPSLCRIDLSIDYTKNSLANPDNVNVVSEPQSVSKFNVMDTDMEATANGKTYHFQSSDYGDTNGDRTDCYFELDSMYFDDVSSMTLRLQSYGFDGDVIEIPVNRVEN
ncbi:hypothetical protein LQZ18_01345 [Lachnospiraceae bacterium ZAX-1]